MPEDKKAIEKIDATLTKVDWGSTSPAERQAFSMVMLALELASQAKKISTAVSRGRLVTLLTCIVITGALILFNTDPGIILGITICAQMLLFGLSQIIEYGSEVLMRRSESNAQELVEKLAKRYPLKDGSEDLFIL